MSEQSCAESRRAASGLNHVTKMYKGGDTPTRNLRHTLNPAAGPRREPETTMSADKAFIGLSVAHLVRRPRDRPHGACQRQI